MKQKFKKREQDWKNGAIVYQVIVDRFAPSAKLEQKKNLYASPLRLMKWHQPTERGAFNENAGAWQHELDFWGGDLQSLSERLEYLKKFHVDVLYLNPIFRSLTNHKYDTHDYFEVDPVYGDNDDLRQLVKNAHDMGLKVMLDGVFNHVGRASSLFKQAITDPASSTRKFFRFYKENPVCWNNVYNLPELNLHNAETRQMIYGDKNSVVRHWIRNCDIDGWRLDVAYEFGPRILSELSEASRQEKPDACIIGEIWNYPAGWSPAVDGVINMHARSIILRMVSGSISAADARRLYAQMIEDCNYEYMLKSWMLLDNHDTPRLASMVKSKQRQMLARVIQFTLPGSVCMYYGSEFGLKGANDPEQRNSMPWHQLDEPSDIFHFHQRLAQIRKNERALKIGDFVPILGLQTFSFMRTTDRVDETIVLCANPSAKKVKELLQLRDGRIHDYTLFSDLLTGKKFMAFSGFIDLEIAPRSALILKPVISDPDSGYSRYKHLE